MSTAFIVVDWTIVEIDAHKVIIDTHDCIMKIMILVLNVTLDDLYD